MKNKITYHLLLLSSFLLYVSPSCLYAQANPQTVYDLKQMLPTSPEAAILGRFGDVPIGYYTGTADISIPLYTIKEDGLEVPIVLSYHSSGIKVDDQATNVGLGWLLEPGGGIIQVVNGMADQVDNFAGTLPTDYAYLNSHVSLLYNHDARGSIGTGTETCSPAPNDGDTQNSMDGLQSGELQPDIYQYSFPGGYSGKFYINPQTKKIVMIDKQKQIFFQQNVNGTNWFAETLDGDKYYFNDPETAIDGSAGNHQGYTFKLSQIVLHNGKTINFTYTNSAYNWDSGYSEFYHTPYPSGVGGLMSAAELSIQSQSSDVNYYNKTITQITTSDVIINFNLGTRTDMQAPCIQSVDVLSAVSGQKLKTFIFNYGYFGYSQVGNAATGTNLTGQRLKLLSVQETGYNQVTGQATSNPPYQFIYNETAPLPMKTSFAKDFWGYYNGVNNTNLLTDLTYPYYAGMLGANFPYSTVTYLHGANRATDTSQVSLGMLTKVTYPTGGYTQFKYESNSFNNYDYPDVNKETSRLTNLTAEDQNGPNDHAIVSFTTTRPLSFTINILFSHGFNSNNITYAQMSPAYVTLNQIENGTTTVIKTWQMTSSDQQTAYNSTGNVSIPDIIQLPFDPNATYQLVASLPDALGNQTGNANLGANVTASLTYYDVPNNTTNNLSYGGGVRVAAIRNYDNTGTLISNKSLKYINADETPSGILMSPLLLTYYRYINFSDVLTNDPQGVETIALSNIWYLSSESSVPFSTAAGGNLVGYSRVVETELNNNIATNGTHVYSYNNAASETGPMTPDNPNLLNGKVAVESIYDNSGNLLLNNSFSYMSLSDSVITGFKNYNNIMSNASGCARMNGVPLGFNIYNILEYPIISHWYMLSSKSTTHYDGSTPLTTYQYYKYNAMGQIIADSTISSKNETLTNHYIYPYDQLSNSTAQQLVSAAFYNDLLEQHVLKNGVETTEAKIAYNTIDNQLVKSGITRSYNGGTLFTDVTFDAYGPNQSLLQATERGVQPSAFVYDQNNSYLLAEVKNAATTDIAYSSFELNQAGNWTIGSASRNTTGFSGTQSYALSGTNTLSKAGLNSAITYVVSYWTTNSSPFTIAGTIGGYPVKGVTLNGWTYYEHQVTGQTTVALTGTGNIDEVRLYPNTAQMKTYTYSPLIGMTSSINEKNQVTFYEYDSFQRLLNIKDQYGNVVKHMSYHYQGQ